MSGKERGRKSPPEHLSPEDKLLWAHAMRDATAAHRRPPPPVEAAAEPPPEAAQPAKPRRPARAQPPAPAAKDKPPLAAGATADVDRRTAERLKRGQMPVEATLDLHGHTQAEAHRALDSFLAAAHASGRRCVLVVTGKGARTGGVLRAEVPKWLNEPPNRARIVAFAGARPQHGGGGALYVLLRRQRGE